MDSNLRNLKDFLTLYNKVTELCFNRCVDNLSQRELFDQEKTCVDRCVTKFARFNQSMMKSYVDVQTKINAKRMEEAEQAAKLIAEQQQKEVVTSVAPAVSL
ncbi:mitochondrial import inner membrane translocase subunit Tim10B [Drosophila sulfurigaster albostrigata]|uniref:mitochondrial import inner membrane translocase subunit Tim10B n=1 Tax=Drosophila sulfurigaster albostrigata TaxID=89887 RepID=UPI002D21A9C2|nr:mitochondrial import inner membrane translocase subunit Tim10B [Drosophila sulfurigaster albostrigata]